VDTNSMRFGYSTYLNAVTTVVAARRSRGGEEVRGLR
jgi:hypothetical protein